MSRVILVIAAAVLLVPLYLTAIGSLQNILGVMAMPPRLWPHRVTGDNYAKLTAYPVSRWALNTTLLAAIVVAGTILVCLAAGYSLALRPRPLLFWAYMATVMLPGAGLLIPHFVVIRYLGLLKTLWAAALPLLWWPIGIFFSRAYIRAIPRSYAEAARLDGAGEVVILWRVILPLCGPVAGVIAVVKAVQVQQDYVWQVLTLRSQELQTLIVGLVWATTSGDPGAVPNPLGMQMAAGMILLAPLVALFVVAGRTMMRGLPMEGLRE